LDVEPRELNPIVADLGSRHYQDSLDVGEIDPPKVAFGELDGPADEASGEGRG
jgi:hypothetical protein